MFRYFPNNYVWNLSVDLAIEMGARIGEIEEMCAPLRAASEQPDAEGTRAFAASWVTMGEKLCRGHPDAIQNAVEMHLFGNLHELLDRILLAVRHEKAARRQLPGATLLGARALGLDV